MLPEEVFINIKEARDGIRLACQVGVSNKVCIFMYINKTSTKFITTYSSRTLLGNILLPSIFLYY